MKLAGTLGVKIRCRHCETEVSSTSPAGLARRARCPVCRKEFGEKCEELLFKVKELFQVIETAEYEEYEIASVKPEKISLRSVHKALVRCRGCGTTITVKAERFKTFVDAKEDLRCPACEKRLAYAEWFFSLLNHILSILSILSHCRDFDLEIFVLEGGMDGSRDS